MIQRRDVIPILPVQCRGDAGYGVNDRTGPRRRRRECLLAERTQQNIAAQRRQRVQAKPAHGDASTLNCFSNCRSAASRVAPAVTVTPNRLPSTAFTRRSLATHVLAVAIAASAALRACASA